METGSSSTSMWPASSHNSVVPSPRPAVSVVAVPSYVCHLVTEATSSHLTLKGGVDHFTPATIEYQDLLHLRYKHISRTQQG